MADKHEISAFGKVLKTPQKRHLPLDNGAKFCIFADINLRE